MNNSKLLFFLACLVAVMLTAPVLTAAPRGGGGRGHHLSSMGTRPGMGTWSGQRWSGGNLHGGDYGYGNGYGDTSHSRVAELQRRLARAGYYRGSIDGVLGPQTRRAIRAYERDHGNVG